MMNSVQLTGRLTADPELRRTPSGIPVATFRLAVNRPFANSKGEREADFITIVAWRKAAEFVAAHLGKGRLIGVEGRLQTRSYEAQDGSRRWVAEVVANRIHFLDSRKANGNGQTGPEPDAVEDAEPAEAAAPAEQAPVLS